MFAQGSGASIAILVSGVDPSHESARNARSLGRFAPPWLATSPFVPEAERPDYLSPAFLKKMAPLDPLDWMPKIQAKQIRLDIELFDTVTPRTAREKLQTNVSQGSSVKSYKTIDDFKAAFNDGNNLEWIQRELR